MDAALSFSGMFIYSYIGIEETAEQFSIRIENFLDSFLFPELKRTFLLRCSLI